MPHNHLLMSPGSAPSPQPPGMLRRCACGGAAGPTGECAACRQRRETREGGSFAGALGPTSAPLEVRTPSDPAEQEAEQAAAQVTRGGPLRPAQVEAAPGLQRQALGGAGPVPPELSTSWASAGQPLDPGTRTFMESRFGHDFSRVRIHADSEAARRAGAVQARAYTVGQEIAFGAGQYAPQTSPGRQLLAHELTHVVQQRRGGPALQRAPLDPQDVRAARARAGRLAQRIRIHTKLSKEVRASINRDLAFFGGAAKEAYLQIIRPALQAVTEIQMPAQSMRRELPPVRPVTTLSLLTAEDMCGGKCYSDDEIYAPIREMEQREKDEQAQRRAQELDKLRSRTKDWGADQAYALELLGEILDRSMNPDPRGVADFLRPRLLARYEAWLRAVDGQRMAACAKDAPGLIATVRGRFNNDDPCKSWFADEYSHGPSELTDLERALRIHREEDVGPADKVYYDLFEYRKKTDPGLLEQEQMASAMVGAFVGMAGGINEKVNKSTPTPPAVKTPPPEPDLRVVQGGGQTTPARQGHLWDTDTPPPAPTFQPGNRPAANDNAVIPPLKATGTDPVRPPDNAPQATRRIVTPEGTRKAPPDRGTVTPATDLPDSAQGDAATSDRPPYRGKGSKQMSKNYAHDVGVAEGRRAAEADGLVHSFDNPFGIDPNTPGQDSVFINPRSRQPVIVEMKGGESNLAPGQMSNAEINRQVRNLEQRLPNHPVTRMVRDALDQGTLEGRTYTTRIDANGTPLPTTMQDHGTYHRIP